MTSLPSVKITADFEGCDGCAICDLMKTNKGTDLPSLQDAFATESLMQEVAKQVKSYKETTKENLPKKKPE
ncbi:MAG TPA: hypothetical protein PKA42_01515 [Candidatus Paceibacterota bacterium]|nr:hypothetical protein [Candidatus Paceibacterota bacterium]HMO82822.1 hypothetical protein [Candidatus Paceibacterota bacterium]